MESKRKPRALQPPPPGRSLQELYPKVAAEWHPTLNENVTPSMVTALSSRVVWWQCTLDDRHIWAAPVSRRSNGSKCGVCANRVIIPGVNDFASSQKYAHVLEEWHPDNERQPTEMAPYSNDEFLWQCKTDPSHVWKARLANRTMRGSQCPECSLIGKQGTRTTPRVSENSTLLKEWHPSNDKSPHDVTTGSAYEAMWLCSKDKAHVWTSQVHNRARGAGCPYCAKVRVEFEKQNLVLLFPDLVKELHPDSGIDPTRLNPSSPDSVLWQCQEDPTHSWMASPHTRTAIGTGCSICSGNVARESLMEHSLVAESWGKENTIKPNGFSAGSSHYAWWKCMAHTDHPEWQSTISDRVRGRNCPACASINFASKGEGELANAIQILLGEDITIQRHVRKIPKISELDIYIPEKQVAVEFNGIYWHSDEFKTTKYHLEKSTQVTKRGIHLIHVWEDDWRERRDTVVRALAHRLGATERLNKPGALLVTDESLTQRYGARTLVTEVISQEESAEFLNSNHIQGRTYGTLHTGLRDKDGILRAVFVAKRIGNAGHEGSWRIERYATRGIVPGGFTKLMKFTEVQIHEQDLGSITKWVTFSDAALSDGGLYRNYGFTEDGFVPPDYMYVINGDRVHKFNYRLKRFRDDPRLKFEEGLSESELAKLNGLSRIWDAGKVRWVKSVG